MDEKLCYNQFLTNHFKTLFHDSLALTLEIFVALFVKFIDRSGRSSWDLIRLILPKLVCEQDCWMHRGFGPIA